MKDPSPLKLNLSFGVFRTEHTIYLPDRTYGDHPNFFSAAGLQLKTYRYYDPTTRGLDFQGLLDDLDHAASGAIVLLHACGHNPTGVDPNLQQWSQIRELIRSKKQLPFFDCAYQPIRMFVADGGECLVAQTYSKIMGLYAERIGAISVVCKTPDVANRVESQLKLVIIPVYTNPPLHGAAIVAAVLSNRELFDEWTAEMKEMVDRMVGMRQQLAHLVTGATSLHRASRLPGQRIPYLYVIRRDLYELTSDRRISVLARHLCVEMDPSAQNGTVSAFPTSSGTANSVIAAHIRDRSPLKLNLSFGVYRTEHTIYLPDRTYGDHPNFFSAAGLQLKTYRYYDPTTRGLDFQGLLDDLDHAASGAIVLLHACGHNPTGVDPNLQQWNQIRELIRSKKQLPFFDCAYQPIRMFVADGGECLVAQTYSKIMGLYAERIGAISVVCKTPDVANRVESQLKLVIIHPALHGAAIVTAILSNRELFDEWTVEMKAMVDRMAHLVTGATSLHRDPSPVKLNLSFGVYRTEHTIYLPEPTYGNHPNFFLAAGLQLKTYRYYDPTTRGLDFQGLLDDLGHAASGAIVLFHACGHNPTGVDPNLQQWNQIRELIRSKQQLPFFDCAYQPIRMFVADGGECLVAQSYSKIMGLYAERIGALSIVCKTPDVANRVESQLKLVIRPMYSNPPLHGAAIVATILNNREMLDEWTDEMKEMIDRMVRLVTGATSLHRIESRASRLLGQRIPYLYVTRRVQLTSDRRISVLARHLCVEMDPSSQNGTVSGSPTSSGTANSVFSHVVRAPEDPILGVTVAYNKDPSPVKLNLGVGAYRTEEGKPLVLNVVRKAEQQLVNDRSRVKEYLPITGLAEFNKLSAKLIFGADSPAIRENRVTTVQCLSGTGSLRVGGEFLARHHHQRTIYIPQPTWGNHTKVFALAGLTVKNYRYYDPATRGLDFNGLLEDLGSAPSGAVVLLHACAHNPTGVDPTLQQWEQIRQLIRSKGLLPFFDSAYQGFASGSLDADAESVRMFVADGGELLMAQSYAKNMGLYGERVGALSIVCKTADVASKVESQLKLVIRPMYSNPPIHGPSIVAVILKDSHIIKQIGMFTFTGLNREQVAFMTKEYHIYMTSDGRISMAGLSSKTVPHLADAIHAAVTRV
ncbi:hypothetical protein Tsubulata_017447 [Turnera subulata]|uniref:Aspartate aminotransferase n=1 Tax=Turnera subulata TaxID=218843 RepID=A0A9Q0G699_9ROSI|nr:hypothetical protein Tsubulata_017447 [Turnera subulata]